MLKKILFLLLLGSLLLSAGCSSECSPPGGASPSPSELRGTEFFAMDTYMEIKGCGASDELLEAAAARIYALDDALSVTRAESELSRLNREGSSSVPEETYRLLERSLELCRETDGALDITVYPIVRAWGFTTGSYRVPDPDEIASFLKAVDYREVSLTASTRTVSLPEGAEIDLGAVTKGYAVDALRELFEAAGVGNALFNLGGNVLTMGTKPDGSLWRVGVQDPLGEGLIGSVAITGKALITSGGYERFFEDDDGTVYWHIMDPQTGYPADGGLISVTIMGDEGVRCDALSTALFIMGTEKAEAFWRAHGDFDMILVTSNGDILLTPGAADVFTPDGACPYETAVIEP
ncbi:MAG: FAD:protein FMN transferase [Oscillospiraceae bacterium]|nr:FAD:protein FMN transferase [Oscillospiraceae bacterium]